MKMSCLITLLFIFGMTSCTNSQNGHTIPKPEEAILPGIYAMDDLVLRLEGKAISVVSNHTGEINGVHLVDTLLNRKVIIKRVFAPEHGFRGNKADGEEIDNSIDPSTGIEIISLYAKSKKLDPELLKDVDIILFDIQDVGARFYTFLSTLHYVMESAAESGVEVIVLDRPNPNGFYVDGPVLEEKHKAFVGMHPVPIVYGMTIGEYAQMINGEGWLKGGIICQLSIIPCTGYTHSSLYQLPFKPSPNLPDMKSIYWYPSLCLLEGTIVSVGRGTPNPFTWIGEPSNSSGKFEFTPISIKGASINPKHQGELCFGYDLTDSIDAKNLPKKLDLKWLRKMYLESGNQEHFINSNGYFTKLAGNESIESFVKGEISEEELRKSWEVELSKFKEIRKKYLIYPD